MEKRGSTVLLTVIGIATLLVAVVGATFAYFTANVAQENSDKVIEIKSATLGTITFNHGTGIALGTTNPVYPGEKASNVFTVKSQAETTDKMDYVVKMNVTQNTFVKDAEVVTDANGVITSSTDVPGVTNVQYLVCATLSENSDTELAEGTILCSDVLAENQPKTDAETEAKWVSIDSTVDEYTLATAKLGTKGATDSWTLFVRLNEIGTEQNHDQGRVFVGNLSIEAATQYTANGEVYSAN